MPRIPPAILDSVCYLYPDERAAAAGRDFGWTAFLVFIPSPLGPDRGWIYAVTNWHVACRDGASVLRVNKHDNSVEMFPFGPEDWAFDPRFDIAVIHLPLTQGIHRYAKLSITDGFVLQEDIEEKKIGSGEDVL